MKSRPLSIALIFGSSVLICTMFAACQPNPTPTQSIDENKIMSNTPEIEIATIPPEAIMTEVQYFAPLTPTAAPTCTNSLPSRLSIEQKARVAYTDGSEMRIRVRPGFEQEILDTVPEGTEFNIVGSSQCADNITWWPIRTDGGLKGWMAEYQDGVYLLEPVQ
jgi:hypothetical protein